jgi:hypothetical protein
MSKPSSNKKVYRTLWSLSGGVIGCIAGGVGIVAMGTGVGIPGVLLGVGVGRLIAAVTEDHID